jgi:hypothetical protein
MLLSGFDFITSGECTVHPATHNASPEVVCTSALQYPPPF